MSLQCCVIMSLDRFLSLSETLCSHRVKKVRHIMGSFSNLKFYDILGHWFLLYLVCFCSVNHVMKTDSSPGCDFISCFFSFLLGGHEQWTLFWASSCVKSRERLPLVVMINQDISKLPATDAVTAHVVNKSYSLSNVAPFQISHKCFFYDHLLASAVYRKENDYWVYSRKIHDITADKAENNFYFLFSSFELP